METGVVVAAVAATAVFTGEGGGGLGVGAKRGWVPVSSEAWCRWLGSFLCRGDVYFDRKEARRAALGGFAGVCAVRACVCHCFCVSRVSA